jgi:hypothetical protein
LARLPIALIQAIHISQQLHLMAIRQPVSEVVKKMQIFYDKFLCEKSGCSNASYTSSPQLTEPTARK